MTTATKDFESTRNPSEGLNSIDSGNLDQRTHTIYLSPNVYLTD